MLLAIDQQRASVVERIVARWGADLGKANDAISIDELRMRLLTLRADRLFAASLAGTEEGVREAIGLVKTTTSSKRLAHTKAIGDIGTDVVYTPVTPCRLVETRGAFPAVYQGDGSASHTPVPFAPNEIRSYTMQGGNGVCLTQLPAGITPSAVQLQVFGMPTTSLSGDIEILPQGAAFGSTATMVYVSTIAFNTVSTAAKVNVANTQIGVQVRGGGAHLAIDVVGYFAAPSGNGGKFFRQGGNAFGTTALLGSVDNQPVTVLVNTQPVMRYLPNATSPNIIGGHPDNAMVPGTAYGQTIAGGGRSGNDCFDPMTNGTRSCNNRTLAARATIGGGVANVAGADATISGGGSNTATGAGSTVGGGTRNIASGGSSAVVGGTGNIASDFAATVVGGSGNTASASATLAAGSHANAAHFGCFVWADGSSVNVASCLQNNQFVA
ncbi:MAG TPA: hypothetical protein VGL96_01660, partial [Casimicrobiaceae bacterium]